MIRRLLNIILFFSLLISCSEDEIDISNIYNTWSVVSIHTVESINPNLQPDKKVTINFKENNKFDIMLEVNNCGGSFNLTAPDGLSVDSLFCTYACCDSEFSMKFINLLRQTRTYKINGSRLTLFNELGFIGLEYEY